jgi:hypothetical protein
MHWLTARLSDLRVNHLMTRSSVARLVSGILRLGSKCRSQERTAICRPSRGLATSQREIAQLSSLFSYCMPFLFILPSQVSWRRESADDIETGYRLESRAFCLLVCCQET